jgi:uncharacterized protein (TIGR00369 family)
MDEIIRYPRCFVCGDQNPHGLNARFFWDGVNACTEVIALEQFEGYKGIFHGGVVAALLDEVMVKAILAANRHAVTAEMTVRYLQPVRTGGLLRFVGRVIGHKGRLYLTTAEATDPGGTIYAQAEGKFLEGKGGLADELKQSLE